MQSTGSWTFNQPTNFNNHVRVDSSGRLLVGTTTEGNSYADNLTIADSGNCGMTIRSGTNNFGSIYFSDATSGAGEYDGYIAYNQPNRFMQFAIGQSERMRIDSSGRVGIGDSSPDVAFSIKGSGGPIGRIQATDQSNARLRIQAGNASSSYLEFGDSDDDDVGEIVYGHSDNHMRFRTNGSEQVRIDSSGRVGIGTTSPGQRLDVAGDARLIATNDTARQIIFDANRSGAAATIANVNFAWDGTNVAQIRGITGSDTTNKDDGHLEFFTAASGSALPRMRIDSSGRLIIGASSARVVGTTRQFTIEGTDSPTSSASIFRNSNTTGGAVLALGKSRGTSDGSSTILQNGDQAGAIFFHGADGTDAVSQVASISAEIDGTPGSNDMPGRLVFNTTADGSYIVSERMRIDSSGNVGIGTSSPTAKLHVNGAANISGQTIHGTSTFSGTSLWAYSTSSASNAGTIQARNYGTGGAVFVGFDAAGYDRISLRADGSATFNGNVGIGTTSPSQNLHINDSSAAFTQYESGSFDGYVGQRSSGILEIAQAQAGNITLLTNGSERVRLDSSGRLLVGHSAAISTTALGAARAQIVGTDNVSSQLSVSRFSNDNDRPRLTFIKSRSGTKGTNTILQNGDAIGRIEFLGADGSATNDYPIAAHIGVEVDGTPGADDMPGRIVLATTADGASSPTERMRIDSSGLINVTGGIQVTENVTPTSGSGVEIFKASASSGQIQAYNRSSSSWMDLVFKANTQQFYTNNSERMRILSSGGLTFNGDTAQANALDDYEEGTWTPSVGGNATYNTQTGTYTKIGRFVYLTCHMSINTLGTGENFRISGIPFNSTGGLANTNAVGYFSGLNRSVVSLTACMDTANVVFTNLTSATTGTTLNSSIFQNSTDIRFSIQYQV